MGGDLIQEPSPSPRTGHRHYGIQLPLRSVPQSKWERGQNIFRGFPSMIVITVHFVQAAPPAHNLWHLFSCLSTTISFIISCAIKTDHERLLGVVQAAEDEALGSGSPNSSVCFFLRPQMVVGDELLHRRTSSPWKGADGAIHRIDPRLGKQYISLPRRKVHEEFSLSNAGA